MGKLYVVATPIGNLEDISARALRVLSEVEFIAAEDTRRTGILLSHFGLSTPMRPYHEHNEEAVAQQIVEAIEQDRDVALVSDAGTPQIADPGFRLVRIAHQRGVTVVPIPGASAVTALLSVSGNASHSFVFEGFLSSKAGQRATALQNLAQEQRSLLFYESPHRILASLKAMSQAFGENRELTLARELTKLHEQIVLCTLRDAVRMLEDGQIPTRGEFVVLVSGSATNPMAGMDHRLMMEELLRELPPGKAADIAAKLTGESRKDMYRIALALKQEAPG
jgi:16S rRNA (cytidine1402-2'-O)-methyltransferase